MNVRKWLIGLGIVLFLSVAVTPFAFAAELVVVATPATFARAADWTALIKSKGITVRNVAPAELSGFKEAPYLVLMGGMDEAGGIKPLAEKALGKSDFEWVNKAGNSRMFVKSNVWSGGQEIIIFAGADGAGADDARKRNRPEWWEFIREWFRIEDDGPAKGGTPLY